MNTNPIHWLSRICLLALLTVSFQAHAASKHLIAPPFDHVSLSPEGTKMAMTEMDPDGKMKAYIVSMSDMKSDRFTVSDGEGGQGNISAMQWIDDEHLVLLSDGKDGDSWLHVFTVGGQSPDRIVKEGKRSIVRTVPSASEFLIAEIPKDGAFGKCRVLRYKVGKTDSPEVVYQCDSSEFEVVTDLDGAIRMVKRQVSQGGPAAWFRLDGTEETQLKAVQPWMPVFGVDGHSDKAVIAGHINTANPSIHVYDIAKDEVEQALADNPSYSIDRYGEIIFDPHTGRAVGLRVNTTNYATYWLDPRMKEIQAKLDEKLGGSVNRILSWDSERDRLLVERVIPMLPTLYCFVELGGDRVSTVIVNGGRVEPSDVGPSRLAEIPNRDGVSISAVLTMPAERDPKEKLPLMIWVRSGLWEGLDRLEWSPEANFFANEGFAVLRVNYRGSAGSLGDLYVDTSKSDGILATFRDIEDAAKALVDAGLVDDSKIVIGGEGSGAWAAGYAPLATPGRYAAVLCINGVYDLIGYNDPKTGANVGAGCNLSFASQYSNASKDLLEEFTLLKSLPGYPKSAFVAYGKWSSEENKTQATDFIKALKKSGTNVKFYAEDWWGTQLRGGHRDEAFRRAAAFLKQSLK